MSGDDRETCALTGEYRGHADLVDRQSAPPARAVLIEFTESNQPKVVLFGMRGAATDEILSLVSAATAQLASSLGSLNRTARN